MAHKQKSIKSKLSGFWKKSKSVASSAYKKATPHVKAALEKTKEASKEAYGKAEGAVKRKLHDERKKIALKVIAETKDMVTGKDEKDLAEALPIVSRKYARGGNIDSIPRLNKKSTWKDVKNYLLWLRSSPYQYHIDDDPFDIPTFTDDEQIVLKKNSDIMWSFSKDGSKGTNLWEVYNPIIELKGGGKTGTIVKTKDGVQVDVASEENKRHIFYDKDGNKFKCLGYHAKSKDCLFLNLKTKKKYHDCVKGYYYNDPKEMPSGGDITYKELSANGELIDTTAEGTVMLFKFKDKYYVVLSDNSVITHEEDIRDGDPFFPKTYKGEKKSHGGYMANGGEMHDRMYNFLKDDLVKLEKAVSENDNEEINKFFSYWMNPPAHLNSLKTKTNERMYGFLEEDLGKLKKAIKEGDNEEIEKFFSYWGQHLKSLKMTDKELASQSYHSKSSGGSMATGGGVGEEGFWVIKDEKTGKLIDVEKGADFADVSDVIEEYSSLPNHYTVDWSKTDPRKKETGGKIDTITMDVPLFIRTLEYAREDAKGDPDLHKVAENATELAKSDKALTMKDYDSIVDVKAHGGGINVQEIMTKNFKRIDGMVENWKKEGRAFSSINNEDSLFFEKIGVPSGEVGITSQTGNDLLYYDTNIYASDSDAIKKRKMAHGGELGDHYDLRIGLGSESMDEKISRAIRDLFVRQNGVLDKKIMDNTISALSKHLPVYNRVWKDYIKTMEIKEENGKYVNPFVMAQGGGVDKFKVGDKVKISYISDSSKHNGEVGTITSLHDYNYYPKGDMSVIEKKTQGEITYSDGSVEEVSDFYRQESGLVSAIKKVKHQDSMATGGQVKEKIIVEYGDGEQASYTTHLDDKIYIAKEVFGKYPNWVNFLWKGKVYSRENLIGSMPSRSGVKTLQEKINHINKTYDGVTASKTYSDNRIQVVSPYFNTLSDIKRKEFGGSGLMEKYGNTSSYVLYSNQSFYEEGGEVAKRGVGDIPNNYQSSIYSSSRRSIDDIWNHWDSNQKHHFLLDHTGIRKESDLQKAMKIEKFDLDSFETMEQWEHEMDRKINDEWSVGDIRNYLMAHIQEGQYSSGGSIPFETSNLHLEGYGHDTNGNHVVKVSFPNQRAFSIQTVGVLPNTNRILRGKNKLSELDAKEIELIEKEVVDYVKNYGSKNQKEHLKIYGK